MVLGCWSSFRHRGKLLHEVSLGSLRLQGAESRYHLRNKSNVARQHWKLITVRPLQEAWFACPGSHLKAQWLSPVLLDRQSAQTARHLFREVLDLEKTEIGPSRITARLVSYGDWNDHLYQLHHRWQERVLNTLRHV